MLPILASLSAGPKSLRAQRGAALIWGIALLVLIGAIVGGALVALWVFKNVDARLVLANQPATVTIPEPVTVSAKVLNDLDIVIDDKIHTKVPVNQTVSVPVNDTLKLTADFDATVPIRMTVPVHDTIPIDQSLDLDTVIKAEFLGDVHDLHIRGKVPVKAMVPVNLSIPVDKQVRLKFSAPVAARIKQSLTVPLNMTIDADIPIHSEMKVPVKSDLVGAVTFPKDPTNVIINYADLRLPLRTLALQVHDGAQAAPGPAPGAPPQNSRPNPPDLELKPAQSPAPGKP
jgi:hypothetical protein